MWTSRATWPKALQWNSDTLAQACYNWPMSGKTLPERSIGQGLQRARRLLIAPNEAITDIGDRRRAQLLSLLLLVFMLLTVLGGLAAYQESALITYMLGGDLVCLAGAYGLSRTRRYRVSAALSIIVMSVIPFASALLAGDYSPNGFAIAFMWNMIPLIFGQIFFSTRGMARLITAHLVGLILLLLVPGVALLAVLFPIGMLCPASMLLLVLSWYRNMEERDHLLEAEAHRAEHRQQLEALITELSTANEELTQISRLKDEFLASMSHELRTPLNVVIGMAEILAEEVYGPLTERQRESVTMIESSGQHLLDLINDILDLSKIGAGKLVLDVGPVSIPTLCQAIMRLIRQPAHKKHISIESNVDPAVATILVDQRRLKQVLINLLSNAVKFTPSDGKIGLEVTGDAKKRIVHFVVWDTGIGIAEEDMGRLFRPFVQLDSSLSRQYDGTGLGLSLVYRLTEMQGGSVSVESTVGQGSRFTISLPWQAVDIEQEADASQGPAKPRAATGPLPPVRYPSPLILLADDNEAGLKTLSDYLRAKRYQVRGARNGQEALTLANEQTPTLILMDIQMPGMDGLEAIRRIRANPKLARVPIIALTALAMPGDSERCMAAGANAYVSKPVRPGGLVEMIEAHLQARGESHA